MILLSGTVPGHPLVVAANRDEFFGRPTAPPKHADGTIVSGVDLVSGGTWMGATDDGFVVAVTNQRTGVKPDPTKQSRGALVTGCLAAGNRIDAVAHVRSLDLTDFNPFHLILADAAGVEVFFAAEEHLVLPRGVTVITNVRGEVPVARAQALEIAEQPWPKVATSLATILSEPPTCLHTEIYGTRSATIAAVAPDGLAHYLVSAEAPCRSPLVAHTLPRS